jgi:hypothetical protein
MKFVVRPAAREDVYRDVVRIPERYRITKSGKTISEGSVCALATGRHKRVYAIVRGTLDGEESTVKMDERVRNALELQVGEEIDLSLRQAGPIGEFLWAWNASDPAYRIVARLAVLSALLGLLSLGLGILSLVR